MELRVMAYLREVMPLAVVSSSLLLLASCNAYNNVKEVNPIEKNCGSYETIGYTTKSDSTNKNLLHGEVRLCKTGQLLEGAHIYIKDIKDSLIADVYTDKHGKYAVAYTSRRNLGEIYVSALGATLTITTHDIGKYHKNTELNMRLYQIETFVNEIPLTKDDIRAIEKNRKKINIASNKPPT